MIATRYSAQFASQSNGRGPVQSSDRHDGVTQLRFWRRRAILTSENASVDAVTTSARDANAQSEACDLLEIGQPTRIRMSAGQSYAEAPGY